MGRTRRNAGDLAPVDQRIPVERRGKPLWPVADDRGRLSPGPPRRRGLVEQHPPARVLPLGRLAVDQGAGLPPPRARIASSDAMSSNDERSPGGSPKKTLRITRRWLLHMLVVGLRGI